MVRLLLRYIFGGGIGGSTGWVFTVWMWGEDS